MITSARMMLDIRKFTRPVLILGNIVKNLQKGSLWIKNYLKILFKGTCIMKPLSFEKSKKKEKASKVSTTCNELKNNSCQFITHFNKIQSAKGQVQGKQCAFKILKKDEPDKKGEREIWKLC